MTRKSWKALYRIQRIVRRESYKATADAFLYGVGAVKIGADVPDFIRHVTLDELMVAVAGSQ